MLLITAYIKIFVSLIAIVNPIGAMPIFIELIAGVKDRQRNRIVNSVAVTVCIILLVSLYFGEFILEFFGISIYSFRVGSGILIMLMAISMMHAKISPISQTREEANESHDRESIAIVPMSIPLLAGPGAISAVIIDAHRGTGFMHYAVITLVIALLSLVLWIVLKLSPYLSRNISATGINIFTRIMGLILAAIAVEFIANGVKGLFPTLG